MLHDLDGNGDHAGICGTYVNDIATSEAMFDEYPCCPICM